MILKITQMRSAESAIAAGEGEKGWACPWAKVCQAQAAHLPLRPCKYPTPEDKGTVSTPDSNGNPARLGVSGDRAGDPCCSDASESTQTGALKQSGPLAYASFLPDYIPLSLCLHHHPHPLNPPYSPSTSSQHKWHSLFPLTNGYISPTVFQAPVPGVEKWSSQAERPWESQTVWEVP